MIKRVTEDAVAREQRIKEAEKPEYRNKNAKEMMAEKKSKDARNKV